MLRAGTDSQPTIHSVGQVGFFRQNRVWCLGGILLVTSRNGPTESALTKPSYPGQVCNKPPSRGEAGGCSFSDLKIYSFKIALCFSFLKMQLMVAGTLLLIHSAL